MCVQVNKSLATFTSAIIILILNYHISERHFIHELKIAHSARIRERIPRSSIKFRPFVAWPPRISSLIPACTRARASTPRPGETFIIQGHMHLPTTLSFDFHCAEHEHQPERHLGSTMERLAMRGSLFCIGVLHWHFIIENNDGIEPRGSPGKRKERRRWKMWNDK